MESKFMFLVLLFLLAESTRGTTDQPTSAPSVPTCPTSRLPPSSNPCAVIQKNTRYVSPSGYYWIQGGNGAAVNVYCRMNSSSCCGITGDWMRVGYLDMKNSSHHCPSGFQLYYSPRRCRLLIRRREILAVMGTGTSMILLDVQKSHILLIALDTRECVEGLLPIRKEQRMPSIITIHTTVQLVLDT